NRRLCRRREKSRGAVHTGDRDQNLLWLSSQALPLNARHYPGTERNRRPISKPPNANAHPRASSCASGGAKCSAHGASRCAPEAFLFEKDRFESWRHSREQGSAQLTLAKVRGLDKRESNRIFDFGTRLRMPKRLIDKRENVLR